MVSITDNMVRIASGISACTMPTMTPVILKSSVSGASISPADSRKLLRAPRRPSSTIQAKVRTRKLVQNGRRTQRMRLLRALFVVVASR